MLCALTIPSFDARTDLGAIDPSIVLINFIELFFALSSAWTGIAIKEKEIVAIRVRGRKVLRM
jgi:fumarate reductase subunit C